MTITTKHEPISNGILLAMTPDDRAERIASLSPVVRLKLARIAALGAAHEAQKVPGRVEQGRNKWATLSAQHAQELAALVAQLLDDALIESMDTTQTEAAA